MADRTQVGCLTHPLTRVVLTSNPAIALALKRDPSTQRKRRTQLLELAPRDRLIFITFTSSVRDYVLCRVLPFQSLSRYRPLH